MPDPVYSLKLELAVGSLTDITSYCLRGSFSQALADVFNPIVPDTALFELVNDTGSFSPMLIPDLVPGRKIQFTATHAGSTYNLFSGRVNDLSTKPVIGEKTTVIAAGTEIRRLQNTAIRSPVFTKYKPGSLFTEIMSRSNVASFSVPDIHYADVPYAWYQDVGAGFATQQLLESGMFEFFVDGAGTLKFRERHSAAWFPTYTNPVTITEAADLKSAVTDDIINTLRVRGIPRAQTTGVNTVGWLPQPVFIPASAAAGFWIGFVDYRNLLATPIGSYVTPVASTDYYASANSDGTGANYTSTLSVSITAFSAAAVCSLFNGTGQPVYISRFQVRGYPILDGSEISVQVDQSSSQSAFGTLSQDRTTMIADRDYMIGFAASLFEQKVNPKNNLNLSLINDFPNVLQLTAGEVFSIVNSLAGVNSFWVVNNAQHNIDLTNGLFHQTNYDLEQYRGGFPVTKGAVRLDPVVSSGYLINPNTLTGVESDGRKGILSVWFDPLSIMAITTSRQAIFEIGSWEGAGLLFMKLTANVCSTQDGAGYGHWYSNVRLTGSRLDNGPIFTIQGSIEVVSAFAVPASAETGRRKFIHALAAWDLDPPRQLSFWLNDYPINGPMDAVSIIQSGYVYYQGGTVRVGLSFREAQATKFAGAISELYLNTKEFLDLNAVTNRRKFISPTGKPVDLGSDGSLPTGNAPTIYLSISSASDVGSFGKNYGTGGDFTVVSSFTMHNKSPTD